MAAIPNLDIYPCSSPAFTFVLLNPLGYISDPESNKPACVDLLSGEVWEVEIKEGAVEVPLADYPMILTERSVLELADKPQQPGYEEMVRKLRWTY